MHFKRTYRWMWLLLLIATLSANAQAPIGYWPMDEGSGNTVGDHSGNGHDGTATNAAWTQGIYGQALEFNGTDSIVDIPYFPEVTPTDGATFAAWVFPTDTTRSCVVGQFEGYGLALFNNLQLKSVIWGDDWVSAETIPVEQWSHIAMTWDTASGNRTMLVNGKVVDEKGGAAPVPNVQNNLGIGVWVGWPAAWGDDWFMGIIDEVKFWNRVLTAEEVAQASEEPNAVESAGKLPVFWAKLRAE